MFTTFNATYSSHPTSGQGRVRVSVPKGQKRPPTYPYVYELSMKENMCEALFDAVLRYEAANDVRLNLVSARGDETTYTMRFEVFDETVRLSLLDDQLSAVLAKQERIDRGELA